MPIDKKSIIWRRTEQVWFPLHRGTGSARSSPSGVREACCHVHKTCQTLRTPLAFQKLSPGVTWSALKVAACRLPAGIMPRPPRAALAECPFLFLFCNWFCDTSHAPSLIPSLQTPVTALGFSFSLHSDLPGRLQG